MFGAFPLLISLLCSGPGLPENGGMARISRKLKGIESRNNWKAGMTGKPGTTGIIPVLIYWRTYAIYCAYNLEIFCREFFFLLIGLAKRNGPRCFGAPIVRLAHYELDELVSVQCRSPIDTDIVLLMDCTERKRKYVE